MLGLNKPLKSITDLLLPGWNWKQSSQALLNLAERAIAHLK